MEPEPYDVLIVGGGPAGLSAALVLGRCRRRVVVVDAGHPRNERSHAAHGFFTRDGCAPEELLRLGREQLAPYAVVVHFDAIVGVTIDDAGFHASTRNGLAFRASKLLIATGMRDRIPDVPGLRAQLGESVFVCPYCDGWEHRDQRLAAYATVAEATDSALGLTTWSHDVVLVVPDGPLPDDERDQLARNGVVVHEAEVERVESMVGGGAALILDNGMRVERDAVFVYFGEVQASSLVERLGCPVEDNGTVAARDDERAGPPGVYVAGDASHDKQLVAVAVAEGVIAACAINTALRKERMR
jgi:thioredoxin reductase